MNTTYIHGLNGNLSPVKKEILERYGKVFSPAIDYKTDSEAITHLIDSFNLHNINLAIRSSMGGFAGYYVSNEYQCPTLLFNPALAERSAYQNVPEIKYKTSPFKQIVLGT